MNLRISCFVKILQGVPKKLTSLKMYSLARNFERYNLARKQDKSTNYSLLERRTSNLEIGSPRTTLSESVENIKSYGLQKTKKLFKSKQDGLRFVVCFVIVYGRKPYLIVLLLKNFEKMQSFSRMLKGQPI